MFFILFLVSTSAVEESAPVLFCCKPPEMFCSHEGDNMMTEFSFVGELVL